MRISDVYVNEWEINSDVYYAYEGENLDHFQHIGLLHDLYIHEFRKIIIFVDDDNKYIVSEFNKNYDCIASDEFTNYKKAKSFFKEII